MTHKVEFKVGEAVFIPRIYGNGDDTTAIILSVGRKYAKAVDQAHYQTDDEKEMTFNIDLNTLKTALTGSHIRTVYQNKAQYETLIAEQKKQAERLKAIKEVKWADVDQDKLEQIYAILGI